MNILLTGHRGFIGSHMLTALLGKGHNVDTLEWGETYRSVIDYDWVVHIGANSSTTERDIDKLLRQNLDFSIRLFDDCKTFGVNLQFASSASIYGMGTDFRETAPPDPRNPYAWSKYLFERYALPRQAGNIVQMFRYFNVYGSNEEHKKDQASPHTKFRLQAQQTGQIKLFEHSERYLRDFIPVEQVVKTHLDFFNVKHSGVFNVGTGVATSFLDVATSIAQTYSAEIIDIPMPKVLESNYQAYTCADMTKTNRILNEANTILQSPR